MYICYSLKIVYTGMQLKDTCCMNIYQKLAAKIKSLFKWVMVTLSKLLCILKDYIKDLPKDPRTLLGTKVLYEIKKKTFVTDRIIILG